MSDVHKHIRFLIIDPLFKRNLEKLKHRQRKKLKHFSNCQSTIRKSRENQDCEISQAQGAQLQKKLKMNFYSI